jgi:ubiquinone/menaquinone biosynthesis C-methylase UbiE
LADIANVSFHLASIGDIPLDDDSLNFAFSLGVLHHVPDTMAAIRAII